MTKKMNVILDDKIIAGIFALFPGKIYLVGGALRNFFLKKNIGDFDFAVGIPFAEVCNILDQKKVVYRIVSSEYGVVRVFVKNREFEITSFRIDTQTFGRSATCTFTPDIYQDAKRRDFTVNAIYMDGEGNFIDPYNGITDIKNKILKFIGDPLIRVSEDVLRILRYFRFLPYFPVIDKKSFDVCHNSIYLVETLSANRIRDELEKALDSSMCFEIIEYYYKYKVFKFVPDALENYKKLLKQEKIQGQTSWIRALFVLFKDYSFVGLKKEELKHLQNLKSAFAENLTPRVCWFYYGKNITYDLCLMQNKLDEFCQIDDVIFPVSFNEAEALLKKDLPKVIIRKYNSMKEKWIESDCMLNKKELLKILVEFSF